MSILDDKKPAHELLFDRFIYRCPICDEPHHEARDAKNCCPNEVEAEEQFKCPTCESTHQRTDHAMFCCDDNLALWCDTEKNAYLYKMRHANAEDAGQVRLFDD